MGSQLGQSGSVHECGNRAVPLSEYSLNIRDGLAPPKTPNQLAPFLSVSRSSSSVVLPPATPCSCDPCLLEAGPRGQGPGGRSLPFGRSAGWADRIGGGGPSGASESGGGGPSSRSKLGGGEPSGRTAADSGAGTARARATVAVGARPRETSAGRRRWSEAGTEGAPRGRRRRHRRRRRGVARAARCRCRCRRRRRAGGPLGRVVELALVKNAAAGQQRSP